MARNARAPDPCTERRDRQTADSAPAQRTTATSMTADARRRFSALRRNHWRRGALSHKGACVSHIRGPRLNYRLRYWLSTGRLSVRPFIASDEVWAMVRGNDTPRVAHVTHSLPGCSQLQAMTAVNILIQTFACCLDKAKLLHPGSGCATHGRAATPKGTRHIQRVSESVVNRFRFRICW